MRWVVAVVLQLVLGERQVGQAEVRDPRGAGVGEARAAGDEARRYRDADQRGNGGVLRRHVDLADGGIAAGLDRPTLDAAGAGAHIRLLFGFLIPVVTDAG